MVGPISGLLCAKKALGARPHLPAKSTKWEASDYALDRHFAFSSRNDANGLMWVEAMTTLTVLLDYIGRTFDEALERHNTLQWHYEYCAAKANPNGIANIEQFWRKIADLDAATPVRIAVVEHY